MFRLQPMTMIVIIAGLFFLTACGGNEGLKAGLRKSVETPASPIVETIAVEAAVMVPDLPPATLDYQVGVGDLLSVMVYGRPDLSTSSVAIGAKGSRIDGSGNIQLPLIGTVHVAGLTISAIRDKVEEALCTYVHEPSVVVEVATYRSQPLYLMGQFRTPGVYYMGSPRGSGVLGGQVNFSAIR